MRINFRISNLFKIVLFKYDGKRVLAITFFIKDELHPGKAFYFKFSTLEAKKTAFLKLINK